MVNSKIGRSQTTASLVPNFLASYKRPDSPFGQFEVYEDSNGGTSTKTGHPTVLVEQPPYDSSDRSLSLPVGLEILRKNNQIMPEKDLAKFFMQCLEKLIPEAWEQLKREHMLQGQFDRLPHDQAVYCLRSYHYPLRSRHSIAMLPCTHVSETDAFRQNAPYLKPVPTHPCQQCTAVICIRTYLQRAVQMNAGCTEVQAMNMAASHPVMQLLKVHHVNNHKVNGHLYLDMYSKAAADKLRQCQSIHLGVPGEFDLRITPKTGADKEGKTTWEYAMVSNPLPKSEDYGQPQQLLDHFTAVTGLAADTARCIRKQAVVMYFYDYKGRLLPANEVNINNIADITFVPGGECFRDINSVNREARLFTLLMSLKHSPPGTKVMSAMLLMFTSLAGSSLPL